MSKMKLSPIFHNWKNKKHFMPWRTTACCWRIQTQRYTSSLSKTEGNYIKNSKICLWQKLGTSCVCDCVCVCVCCDMVNNCQLLLLTVVPWDMMNNSCFHVYAQKLVFVIMSHNACHTSNITLRMSHVKCLCWSLGS